MRGLLIIICVALLAVSCRHDATFGHFEPTPTDGWTANDTLSFCIPAPLEGTQHDVRLCLRSDKRYRKTGVMLIVSQQLDTTRVQRVAFPLSDSTGHSLGSGVTLWQHNRHLTNVTMRKGDTLRIRVSPDIQSADTLIGITDIGVMLR